MSRELQSPYAHPRRYTLDLFTTHGNVEEAHQQENIPQQHLAMAAPQSLQNERKYGKILN